ncbi:hypothetical protein QYE76_047480 [Lolium multiflorum]|uniref:Uncharacterized protein n=1 Tax=Lolium multiflorum TaxID=4521 RepID=A0AAD8TRU1_LOLMU|nr:hypothetical protein QYE76_047480 [Lolium multiflorum]
MQSQPISPESASKSKVSSGPAAPRAPIKARTAVRKVAARKTLKRRNPSPDQESLHASTEDNSSKETQSSRGDSSSGNSGKITTQSQPDLPPSASRKRPVPEPVAPKLQSRRGRANAQRTDASRGLERNRKPFIKPKGLKCRQFGQAPSRNTRADYLIIGCPLVSGEGCDLSGLLTFDPESIEPAPSTACDEPRPSAVQRQFQRLKALLSSPIETLVEDPEEVKSVLEEIQHHLPVTLQVKLGQCDSVAYRSRVKLARRESIYATPNFR